jgi:hypothetical protein
VPPVWSTTAFLYELSCKLYCHRRDSRRSAVSSRSRPPPEQAAPSEEDPTTPCGSVAHGQSRSLCWACAVNVCTNCMVRRELQPRKGAAHLATCVPYCATCYWRWLMSRRWDELNGEPAKECPGHRKEDNGKVPTRQRTAVTPPAENKSIQICRGCSNLSDEEIHASYEKREMGFLKELAYRLKCEVCFKPVGGERGVCWWICNSCSAICCWNGHQDIESGRSGGCCDTNAMEMV